MQPTTAATATPTFTNIGNPPTVQQPTMTTSPQRIGFNRKYLLSITGILHIALIIFQFCGWVSAASVVKPGGTSLPTDIMQTRGAYLFFSIVGWLIAIFFFFFCLFNVINVAFLGRLPWTIITLALDALWILPTFIVSIVAATKETQAKGLDDSSGYNFGSFAAAAFFGLVCTVFYVADTIYHVVAIIRGGGPTAPPPYTP